MLQLMTQVSSSVRSHPGICATQLLVRVLPWRLRIQSLPPSAMPRCPLSRRVVCLLSPGEAPPTGFQRQLQQDQVRGGGFLRTLTTWVGSKPFGDDDSPGYLLSSAATAAARKTPLFQVFSFPTDRFQNYMDECMQLQANRRSLMEQAQTTVTKATPMIDALSHEKARLSEAVFPKKMKSWPL